MPSQIQYFMKNLRLAKLKLYNMFQEIEYILRYTICSRKLNTYLGLISDMNASSSVTSLACSSSRRVLCLLLLDCDVCVGLAAAAHREIKGK